MCEHIGAGKNTMVSSGILYIATNEFFLDEAQRSAKRASRVTDLPISVVTHREIEDDLFDEVIIDESPTDTFLDKPRNLLKSPYDETMYVDTDTYIVGDITGVFDCLEYAPLAVTIDAFEGALYDEDTWVDQTIPRSFPEFQTGVMIYQQTKDVREFIDSWKQNHSPPDYPDQLSFRQTLYKHDTGISPLPLRYNVLMGTSVNGPVKILHDSNRFLRDFNQKELDGFLHSINESTWFRILYNSDFKHLTCNPPIKLISFQIGVALMRHGYVGLLVAFFRYLKRRLI